MREGSEELTNEILKDEESCCSDTSCCPPKPPITRDTPKIGRNDPCICGNGRKFKKCCGKNI
ncbi:SEC-C metal-binding domain-containing protein [Methylophilaceae bacterium]|nr:SEC-C metal-binding domain-containing protein [Methylophilaceae bacterium]